MAHVLDFYRPRAKLALELDGDVHRHSETYDDARDALLRERSIETIRIDNGYVRWDSDGVARWFIEECNIRITRS